MIEMFEYHTFLHHSQTWKSERYTLPCLSTIHFYIILKHEMTAEPPIECLSTIHFYIILKPRLREAAHRRV